MEVVACFDPKRLMDASERPWVSTGTVLKTVAIDQLGHPSTRGEGLRETGALFVSLHGSMSVHWKTGHYPNGG
jgi:hypothetical protein